MSIRGKFGTQTHSHASTSSATGSATVSAGSSSPTSQNFPSIPSSYTLDEAADVMAEQLAERLVLHRGVRLRAEAIPELRLDHRESRLDVAPLMVVAQEL